MHPIGDALVVITSDNDDNIKGGIWREVIKAHARLKEKGIVGGTVTLDAKCHAGPNDQTLVAFGRKPSDKNPTGQDLIRAEFAMCSHDLGAFDQPRSEYRVCW